MYCECISDIVDAHVLEQSDSSSAGENGNESNEDRSPWIGEGTGGGHSHKTADDTVQQLPLQRGRKRTEKEGKRSKENKRRKARLFPKGTVSASYSQVPQSAAALATLRLTKLCTSEKNI